MVGDKTPGASTTNMPSITSTTLLLQHDGKCHDMKLETGEGSILSDLPVPLNRVSWGFQFSHRSQFIPSFWFSVLISSITVGSHCFNLIHFTLMFKKLIAKYIISSAGCVFGFFHACGLWRRAYFSLCDEKLLIFRSDDLVWSFP